MNKEKEMTAREFYTAILALDNLPKALADYADKAIVKLDEKNEKRKVSQSALAHKAENENIKGAILALLADGSVKTAGAIAETMGFKVQKITSLLTQLVKAEILVTSDVKKKGESKKTGYSLAVAVDDGDTNGETQALPNELSV